LVSLDLFLWGLCNNQNLVETGEPSVMSSLRNWFPRTNRMILARFTPVCHCNELDESPLSATEFRSKSEIRSLD
jgi:hypothetical protein